VPSGKNENTEFGSAVHFALEKLFTKRKDNQDVFPELKQFIQDFNWFMHKHRESFTKEAFARRMEYGETILTALYTHSMPEWQKHKVVSVERNFKNVVVDGVPIKGQIDKLIFDGNSVTVVDYKTGNVKNAKDKLKPPSAKEPLGGEYWRQGLFYKLLIDQLKTNDWQVAKTVFQFVEPDEEGVYHNMNILPNPDDLLTVREQIKSSWQKIQNYEFYTGCGEATCHWCNFVKDNKQYVDLKEVLNDGDWEE
jgi:DNA helicase-2/ATP-dependent DNA helicase PcrA